MVETVERPAAKSPRLNSVEYWAAKSGIGARTLWRFISRGELRGVRVGARVVVTPEAFEAFMASRPVAGGAR